MRKRIWLFVILCLCLFMGGCAYGGKINTELNINEGVSGVRTMQVAIDTGAVSKYFKGDIKDIDELVRSNCPEALEYSLVSDTQGTSMIFELSFDSEEEYINKVHQILPNARVEVELSQNAWSYGVKVNEDFTSGDLLSWVTDLLVKKGYVSENNKKYIIEMGKTTLSCGEINVTTQAKISYDDLQYVELAYVDVLTDVKDVDRFDRSFVFHVKMSSLGDKKKAVRAIFEEMSVNGVGLSVDESNSYVNYKLTKNNLSPEELKNFSKAVFKDTAFNCREGKEYDYFELIREYGESLGVENYLSKDNQSIHFYNYLKIPDNFLLSKSMEGSPVASLVSSDSYPGYMLLSNNSAGKDAAGEVFFAVTRKYLVKSVNITTKREKKNIYGRSFVFNFEEPLSTEEADLLAEGIQKQLDAVDIPNVTAIVNCNREKSSVAGIEVYISGDGAAVANKTKAFTKKESKLFCSEKRRFYKFTFDRELEDTFDLSEILHSVSKDFSMNHVIDMGATARIRECTVPDSKIEGQMVSFSGESLTGMGIVAYSWNVVGVIFWIAILAVLSVTAVILVKKFYSNKKPDSAN